jgi:hypothetical protein
MPVKSDQDAAPRLLELERILASSSAASARAGAAGANVSELLLGRVLIERIRQTTTLLSKPRDAEVDAPDLVAMRLLLADYVAAVGYLRALTTLADSRLARAAAVIKEDGRRVKGALQEARRLERAEDASGGSRP